MSDSPRMYTVKPAKASSITTPHGKVTARGLQVPFGSDAFKWFQSRPQRFKLSGSRPTPGPNRPGKRFQVSKPGDRAKKKAPNVIKSKALKPEVAKKAMGAAEKKDLTEANQKLVEAEQLPGLSELMKETKDDLLRLSAQLRLDTSFANAEKVTKRVIASDIHVHAAVLRGEEPDAKAVDFLDKWAKKGKE